MGKIAVVTGASGFIGTHLVKALDEAFYDVWALDVVRQITRLPRVQYYIGDVSDIDYLRGIFKGANFVFHLAALPRVQYSIEHPMETHVVNVTGTLNVLEAAKQAGVKRVVFSSSSSVYGDGASLSTREDAPLNPMSPYAEHKEMGERYCRLWSKLYGLETVCLRYFNVYGPDADPNGPYAQVIPKFIEQRLAGKPMTVTGDGEQTRDLIHVRDVVRANILTAECPAVGNGEVINIGFGHNVSINRIAELIGGPVKHIPARLEPHDTLADISRAKELLGWKPTISIEEGIAELKRVKNLV